MGQGIEATIFTRRHVRVAEVYFEHDRLAPAPSADLLRATDLLERGPGSGWRESKTLLVDLTQDEAQLSAGCDKSTRYKIRRAADKDAIETAHLDSPGAMAIEALIAAYDSFARPRKLSPVFTPRLHALNRQGRLVLSTARTAPARAAPVLAAGEGAADLNVVDVQHAYLLLSHRAMLLYSVSNLDQTTDSAARNLIGRANRLLHWRDMLHFKSRGCLVYDFGGINVSGTDPATAGIAEFKLGFGGEVVSTWSATRALSLRGHAVRGVLGLLRVAY